MANQPRIGITVDVGKTDKDRQDYSDAVERAGGEVVFLHATLDPAKPGELIDGLDGLLVPGGADLDPRLYGQEKHEKTKLLSAERTAFDLALLKLARQRKLPTLGICLGCQMMNVERGGTLHQHLPDSPVKSELEHSRKKEDLDAHGVTVAAGTKLAAILDAEAVRANSRHHQAIDKVGRGLKVTASGTDGVIEGIEDPSLPFWVAVQWHPENLANSPHDRLFAALVKAAGEYRAGRG